MNTKRTQAGLPGSVLRSSQVCIDLPRNGDVALQRPNDAAQLGREFIRQRQKEGSTAAKAREVPFGRTPIRKPEAFKESEARYGRVRLR